jgi:hypothetical protein
MGNSFETPIQPPEHANSDQREQFERAIAGRRQEIRTLEVAAGVLAQKSVYAKWRRQLLGQIEAVRLEIQTLKSTHINLARERQTMTVENRHLTLTKEGIVEEWRGLRRVRRMNVSATAGLTDMFRNLTVERDGLQQSNIKLERNIETIYPGCPGDFGALEADTRNLSAHLKELEAIRETWKQENGSIENEIKKLSVDNGRLQSYIRTIDSDNRNLRQSTQAQRTEPRTSHNTQESVDKFAKNTALSEDTTIDCCICDEPLTDGHPVSVTRCRHRFHTACIKKYIEVKGGAAPCPFCRDNIPGVQSLTPQAQWIQQNRQAIMFSQFAVYLDK